MGLAEKRTAEAIKTEKLPVFLEKLKEASGYDITVNIHWDTFTAFDQYPLSRLERLMDSVLGFVKSICADAMGKEALQDAMQTVELINTDKNEEVKMELKDKVLSLTAQLVQGSFVCQSDSQIASYVEGLL